VKKAITLNKLQIIKRGLNHRYKVSFTNLEDREILQILLKKKGYFRKKKELSYIYKAFSSFNFVKEMKNFLTPKLLESLLKDI